MNGGGEYPWKCLSGPAKQILANIKTDLCDTSKVLRMILYPRSFKVSPIPEDLKGEDDNDDDDDYGYDDDDKRLLVTMFIVRA